MKINFLKVVFLSATLTISSFANSALITHNGYTLDSASNIVVKGGTEYLQWSVTAGQSINSALTLYSADGWSLVSNLQMAALYTDFGFNESLDENAAAGTGMSFTAGSDDTTFDHFIELFGITFLSTNPAFGTGIDANQYTQSIFGSDTDNDGFYNQARVSTDYIKNSAPFDYLAYVNKDNSTQTNLATGGNFGVALVRELQVPIILVSVPEPLTLTLLGLGLIGLTLGRFKSK
ncbi:MAG: hypothetical protein ACI9J5_003493 [Paraglaciecola sp.]|jgi:hypothetical protein